MMSLPFNDTRRVVVPVQRPRSYCTLYTARYAAQYQIGIRIGTSFMDTNTEQLSWYALQVVTKKEKYVASALSQKGYACFLPVYTKRTVWSDRNKTLSVPL